MSSKHTVDAFERWRHENRAMVLVTVFYTEGSTYSKAGHQILIADNGDYQGLVSGGCLEGDLGEHAKQVLETGNCQAVTYDLRDEADDIWGMGIGCNGVIKALLQPLVADNNYEPFNSIAEAHLATQPGSLALIIASDDEQLPVGGALIRWEEQASNWQLAPHHLEILAEQLAIKEPRGKAELIELKTHKLTALFTGIKPIPRLLILGAGPDAIPLLHMAQELGWFVTIVDHRDAYIQKAAFQSADQLISGPAEELEQQIYLNSFSSAVIMSHHLETDRTYLRKLADTFIPYIGLLGPKARRDRLIDELAETGQALAPRIHGPVGIDISADSAETIALAILAQIQKSMAT